MGEPLADPSSLLGQVQRGRGAGFLAALTADPTTVTSLLLTCILDDPRFDRQLEQRADYYAQLAIHVHLPLAPLENYLQSHTDERAGDYARLPVPVLGRMAWRGHNAAAAILVHYLSYGPEWTEAFDALVGGGHVRSVTALGRIILERFPDDAVLADEIERSGLTTVTCDRWAAGEPRVASIIASLRCSLPRPSDESIRASIDPAWDTSTLVSRATHDSARIFGEVAGQRAGARDLPALLDAFFGDDTAQIRASSRALAIVRLRECLPRLLRFVEEFDDHPDAPRARYRMRCVRSILAAMPEALPIARAWLHADGWARRSVALSILEQQSEEADVLPLRALLASALDRDPGDVAAAYVVEGCLDALVPFPAQVPYEELAHVFERTWSMWNRRGAAELMADGHLATFTGSHAVECLWDCEETIVEIGCAHADLSMPLVSDRLNHLWHSPYEEEGVRRRAEKRLQAVR